MMSEKTTSAPTSSHEAGMKPIPSFTIDHLQLLRGIYVSRKDKVGNEVITTFDVRMKEPNH